MTMKHSITVSKIAAAASLVALFGTAQQALGETNRLCSSPMAGNCYLTGNFPPEFAAAAGLDPAEDAALTVRFIEGVWSMGGVVIGTFGYKEWTPVVGDWDGDGFDNVGVYKNGLWIFKNSLNFVNPGYDVTIRSYGDSSWTPIVGNWSGDDKVDTLGLYKDGEFRIRMDSDDPASEEIITFELPVTNPGEHEPKPVAGSFDDNEDLVGIIEHSTAMYAKVNTTAHYAHGAMHADLVRGPYGRPSNEGNKQPIVVHGNQVFISLPPEEVNPVHCRPATIVTGYCEWIDENQSSIGNPNEGTTTDFPVPIPF